MKVAFALVSTALLGTVYSDTASGAPLNPATYTGIISLTTNSPDGSPSVTTITDQGSISNAVGGTVFGVTGSVNIAPTPAPSIVDSVIAISLNSTGNSNFGSAIGTINYSMEIVGPGPTVLTDISSIGGMTLGVTGSGSFLNNGGATFTMQGPSGAVINNSVSITGNQIGGSYSANWNGVNKSGTFNNIPGVQIFFDTSKIPLSTVLLQTNTIYQIALSVTVGTHAYPGVISSASGDVDPIFRVDPLVLNSDQYSFEFSPGIGNSAAPIPGTVVLFASGLIGLSTMVRRRTRKEAGVCLSVTNTQPPTMRPGRKGQSRRI